MGQNRACLIVIGESWDIAQLTKILAGLHKLDFEQGVVHFSARFVN